MPRSPRLVMTIDRDSPAGKNESEFARPLRVRRLG
jgi:hypothetical protein